MKTNHLILCAKDFFSFIASFVDKQPSDETDVSRLRQQAKDVVSAVEIETRERLMDAELVTKVKYGLVAYIDEFVMRHLGAHGYAWSAHSLQLEYFGDNLAGERFFDYLTAMRLQSERYLDGLMLYYVLLTIGFEGQYRLNGSATLAQLKIALAQQIGTTLRVADATNTPSPEHMVAHRVNWLPSAWSRTRVLGVGILALGIFVGCLQGSMGYQARKDRKLLISSQLLFSSPPGEEARNTR